MRNGITALPRSQNQYALVQVLSFGPLATFVCAMDKTKSIHM